MTIICALVQWWNQVTTALDCLSVCEAVQCWINIMEMLPLCVTICSLEQCLSNLSTVHQCTRDKIIRCQAFLRKECWVHTDIWYYLNLPSVDRVVEDHHTVIVIINVKFQGLDLKCANIFITVGFLCLFVSIYTEVLVSGFAVTGTFAVFYPEPSPWKEEEEEEDIKMIMYMILLPLILP